MATPAQDTLKISCPGCGAHFTVPSDMAGRQGKCAECGKVISISRASAAQKPPAAAQPTVEDPLQQILVVCRVCQTRMYGFAKDVGRKMKCPDCGALTVIPVPSKPKVAKQPEALEGEQYEVWPAEEQPLPSELAKQQPNLIRVSCWLCNTLMYAREDQVGQELVCPDCHSRTKVIQPAAHESAQPFSIKSGYEVSPTTGPREAPEVIAPDVHRRIYDQERVRLDPNTATDGKSRKRRILVDEFGRPKPPSFPLIRGVWTFPFYIDVMTRWVGLAGGMILCALPLEAAITVMFQGIHGAGLGAISSVLFVALGSVLFFIWYLVASAHWLAIVTDSADGLDMIELWPGKNPTDHFLDAFYIVMTGVISALPGWAISAFPGVTAVPTAIFVVGSVLVFFPVFLLSALEEGSPFGIFSGKVLSGMIRSPGSTILLYVESFLLAALMVLPLIAAELHSDLWYWSLPIVGMAVSFAYFRLMGRYGWCLGEAIAIEVQREVPTQTNDDQEK